MLYLRNIIMTAGLLIAIHASAGNIAFKLGENGDPTGGGTDPAWTLQGSGSYEKTSEPLVAVYSADLDADTVDDVTVELRTSSASADTQRPWTRCPEPGKMADRMMGNRDGFRVLVFCIRLFQSFRAL